MDKEFFNGKTVLVMGLGRFGGGVDSALFACRSSARVTVTDLAHPEDLTESLNQLNGFDIDYHLGAHIEDDFHNSDIVIVNPAIDPDNPYLDIARRAQKLITSQIEIFFQLCPCPIIGITGSNGKSTTTALTAHLLEAGRSQKDVNYRNVILSGNIGGKPLLSKLEEITSTDLAVLELSSFQLEQLARIKKAPAVSAITNLTPNHLDRHKTFEAYCQAKENIFKYQTCGSRKPAVSIFNAEDPIAKDWLSRYKKDNGRKCFTFSPDDIPDQTKQKFKLPGKMNLSNLAAASRIAQHFGVTKQTITAAASAFKPLNHRLEMVAQINGIRWYNDSIATTPDSTIAAIEAFPEPKILIAGGYDKHLPFDNLAECIARNTKAIILIGQTAPAIAKAVKAANTKNIPIKFADSMAQAVDHAANLAAQGDIILMSPASASYDMFDNYEHRGREFTSLVKAQSGSYRP